MKFTDFEMIRVGDMVVLSCFTDEPPKGRKVQITVDMAGTNDAAMYEQLLRRLAYCAIAYEDVPDDVLAATLQLMKGRES